MRVQWLVLVVLGLALLAASCSTGPAGPQPGTPAFYWAAAKTTYHNGDFQKADDNLGEVGRSANEFTDRARPWHIVVAAGMAQGYADMADNYEYGAKANRANPLPFRKEASTERSLAAAAALELAEAVNVSLQKDKDATVLLAFEFPTGSAIEPPGLKKVSGGLLVQDSEKDALQKAMIQRSVVLAASRIVGSPDDPAKALEVFKASEVRIPRATFVFALARLMYDQADLFTSNKLDQPNRLKLMCDVASQALGSIPETKETKALAARIQATLKKNKVT
jgi:hypothetical protein